ncbi:hypothetical protein D3C76_1719120 [compost metagenome]
MNHRVGFRQVQAHAAGFKADQENRSLAALEFLHRGASVPGLAGQQCIRDPALVQFIFDQREH